MIESTTDYKNLPKLTTGDEDFRKKFISWDLGDLTFIDIQEYLKVKDTIATTRLDISAGSLPLPNGPGLGISLDQSKLEQYRLH